MKPKTMRKDVKCQNCDNFNEYDRILKVPYKIIVEAYDENNNKSNNM